MKLNKNDIIKNEKNLDICYLITSCHFVDGEYLLKVLPINMGFSQSYIADEVSYPLKLNDQNMLDWLKADDNKAKCYRHVTWRRL